MSKEFVFVTGNMDKVHWLEEFLSHKVDHHKLDLLEIQSLDPEEFVRHKTQEAYSQLNKNVLIEDTSLVFSALGKLPGPLIKYFYLELGNLGMCQLLDRYDDRTAGTSVIYGFYDGVDFKSFEGTVKGVIASEPIGEHGHGWDPIFIPEGQTKTYAEMDESEYKASSVRQTAVQKLNEFLINN